MIKYSELNLGQIEAIVNKLGGMDGVQRLLAGFSEVVTKVADAIVCTVTVNRDRTPEEAIKATGRRQDINDSIVKSMPRREGDKAEVIFFKPGRYLNDDQLEQEFALRNLVPADPSALMAVNEADPTFADEHPNGTHWKDKDGKWCYFAFLRGDERSVHVHRYDHGWDDDWFFAGVRK